MRNNTPLWFGIIIFLLLGLMSGASIAMADTASIDTTVQISICGNNIKEGGEQCDGTDLDNQTCQKQGYEAGTGTLSCSFACDFNYSGCGPPIPPPEPESGGGGQLPAGGSSGGSTNQPDTDRQRNRVSRQEAEVTDEKYTAVRVQGFTSPQSKVFLLKGGIQTASTTSAENGDFSLQVDEMSAGTHNFSVYAIDLQGEQTNPRTFSLEVESDVITTLSEIILPPTIAISEASGENELILSGYTVPTSVVTVLHNDSRVVSDLTANESGRYGYNINTADLSVGEHEFRVRATFNGKDSRLSPPVFTTLGVDTLELENRLYPLGDINRDGSVNLADFSIMTYWYNKVPPLDSADLNKDGQITMRDLSILAYHWTG